MQNSGANAIFHLLLLTCLKRALTKIPFTLFVQNMSKTGKNCHSRKDDIAELSQADLLSEEKCCDSGF